MHLAAELSGQFGGLGLWFLWFLAPRVTQQPERNGLRARYLAQKGYWRVARGERTLGDWDPGRDAGGVGKKSLAGDECRLSSRVAVCLCSLSFSCSCLEVGGVGVGVGVCVVLLTSRFC